MWWKSYGLYLVFSGIIILSLVDASLTSYQLKHHGEYTVAKIIDIKNNKLSRDFKYKFKVKGNYVTGTNSDIKLNGTENNLMVNDHILAVFFPRNPEKSIILPQFKIQENINVDSLISSGIKEKYIKWWKL